MKPHSLTAHNTVGSIIPPHAPTTLNSFTPTNGHPPTLSLQSGVVFHSTPDSESVLSETIEPLNMPPSISPSIQRPVDQDSNSNMGVELPDFMDTDDASQSNVDSAAETPTSTQSNGFPGRRSVSHDSRRSLKRKAVAEDDQYIAKNPELYGLRRSVSVVRRPR